MSLPLVDVFDVVGKCQDFGAEAECEAVNHLPRANIFLSVLVAYGIVNHEYTVSTESAVNSSPLPRSLVLQKRLADDMASDDTKAAFIRIPWAASLLQSPDVVCMVPGSRKKKDDTEDSLFAEVLKSPRTIPSCISFHTNPVSSASKIEEVSTLMTVGDGMNGHPRIMHGGIVAAIIDEAMGILQSVNHERNHLLNVEKGLAQGQHPPQGFGTFTAELKIRYLKPVRTPGCLVAVARYTKKEGRKEWIYAEVRQHLVVDGNTGEEEVVCATGEALFITPKPKVAKL